MACARKVYSYGFKKKEDEESKPWAGMMKDDTKKDSSGHVSKLPLKKGVWTKVAGKSFIHPLNNKKCDESNDPFGFDDDDDADDDADDGDNECLSSKKDGRKISKTVYASSKNSNAIKSRIGGKQLPQDSVTINAEELKLFGSPRKSDINNGPSQGINKCGKLLQNYEKKDMKKNKKVHEKKCRGVTDIKDRLKKGSKHQMSTSALDDKNDDSIKSVEVPKTILDSPKMNPRVRITKAKIDTNVMIGDTVHQNNLLRNRNDILESKLVGDKLRSKDGNTLSVQFIDDNTVLAIKQKGGKKILKDDNISNNENCGVLIEENKLENDLLGTYDSKSKAKSKRSLFSCYDKHGNQSNPILNGNLKELDFISSTDDDGDLIEDTCFSTNIISTKRSLYPDPSHVDATASKKNKAEDVLNETTSDLEDTDDVEQAESLEYSKVKTKVREYEYIYY